MRTQLRQAGRRYARTVTACVACLAMGSGPLAVAAQDPGACGRSPNPALRGLESTLRDALSATWDEGRSAYLILGDEDGPGLMRAERFNGCAPSILNRGAMNEVFLRALRKESPVPMGTATVTGLVDERGRITRARVTRSSGDGRLDRTAVTALRRGRFAPATVEGIPVAVWTSMPMTATAR